MTHTHRLFVLLLLAGICPAGCTPIATEPRIADPITQRTLQQGNLVGYRTDQGALGWLGLPYAAAPVGDGRWRAPKPPTPWDGLRQATTIGDACLQKGSWMGGAPEESVGRVFGAEDCLFLNIWSPEKVPAEGLPVMVWIHGGGNTSGHGGSYDFSQMAERFNLVMVSFNYRLGSLGWFYQKALWNDHDSAEDRSGNFGLLDQIAALRWVQKNIATFGGNPNRVTIFGESAGGLNTFALMVSPTAKGLFQGAIAQSGYTTSFSPREASLVYPTRTITNTGTSNDMLVYWLEAEGYADSRSAALEKAQRMTPSEIGTFLRQRRPEQLVLDYYLNPNNTRLPIMIEDGTVLPREGIATAFTDGKFHRVPMIAGTNRDENNLWLALSPELVHDYLGAFYRVKDEDRYTFFSEYRAKGWKSRGADDPNRWMRKNGGTSFGYRWDWDEEPTSILGNFALLVGAAHGLETTFLTGVFPTEGLAGLLFTDENQAGRSTLSREMQSYWAEFAYSGDPGRGRGGDLPQWARWDLAPDGQKFMVLDTPSGGGLRMSSEEIFSDKLLQQAAHDPRVKDLEDLCWLVYLNLKDEPLYQPEDYLRWDDGKCRPYPPAHYDAKVS